MALAVRSPSRDLATWEPFRELENLTDRMTALWTGPGGRPDRCSPLADVEESDDACTVENELAAVSRDDVDVQLVDRVAISS